MAVKGPFEVDFEVVFPQGCSVKRIEPAWDFKESTRERKVQAHDRDTGLPVWSVTVTDDDPASDAVLRVKVASSDEPVLPPTAGGGRYRPVEFEGLLVQPYVNAKGFLAYSLRAASMRPVDTSGGKPASTRKREAA
jgi:hypothetical protein